MKRKLRKIRIHHEGTGQLVYGGIALAVIGALLWFGIEANKVPFWTFLAIFGTVYAIVLNFYRSPIRYFEGETTEKTVVAPADGTIVVIEEVEENKYFHDRRIMVSIFMSLWNVHANWFPVDGKVKFVQHFNGNYHKAWLPKASEENERTDVIITTPEGHDILCRQVAGAMARRIATYAKPGDECFIDEHMGFIKLGSRVDLYLPLGSEILIEMGQKTRGDQTIIAKLP
ncbi:MAG: phosphatidylserine decarboxylase family protein [Prevotella sp.]|nr:phosphatidylserine decarboxylase family protein [Prevotella sp.]MDD7273847.1 phosphatidylserine decarboxylase family protein [Prevotellaceae bacterium]MDY3936027.1 phosphatidylserine decarboxylase family protein [Prevotella sp.]MDY4218517.1 phosphatidylserine decarboxylase family protein [Prevotella sp.]